MLERFCSTFPVLERIDQRDAGLAQRKEWFMAVAAIINDLWDLWGRIERKPVWLLLSEMNPEPLVSTVDFCYTKDVITEAEAVNVEIAS